jgi:ubiquinone/menaquinone biosynthesis C-methylase UbiE
MKQWNKIFEEKGRVFMEPKKEIINAAKIFKKRGVKKILDLGCVTGRHVVYLTKRGFEVYGYDIAEEGIKLAKEWLKEEGLKASFNVGSIYDKLPYKDSFFDAVISTHAIHHGKIEEIRKAIAEIKRTLKPNGLIFINLRKRRIRKFEPKKPIIEKYGYQTVSYKMIAPRTYIPIEGGEKDLPHYLFDKKGIQREFKDFTIHKIWTSDSGRHYCLSAELKNT